MLRRQFVASAAGALMAQPPAVKRRNPNIILILADDLGYGDIGCFGQKRIRTPHLDRMAAEGLRFTSAYAGSTVCAPSRCSLFTGLHTGHARIRGNGRTRLHKEDLTMTEVLKSRGYRTGLIGKWSLGDLGDPGYPNDKGFDEWYGYFSQLHAHTYYPQLLLHNRRAIELTGNFGTSRKQYAPDLCTEQALRFVDSAAGQPAPFFLHLAYTIPHADNELGRDTGMGQPAPSDAPYTNESWPEVEKNFAAMITRMDADIGKLMDLLKQRGADNDTLVLFTSDNGPHQEGGHKPDFFDSNGIYRGIKRDLTEGGIRVPAIARWPGQIPAGVSSDFAWAFWDVMPTLIELAGGSIPRGLDGQSIVPTLLGRQQKPHEFLYWEFHERGFHQAVRHQDWKGIRYGSKEPLELYNLREDPGEKTNVAARYPDVVQRIERYLATARTESRDFPIVDKPRPKALNG